MGSEANSNKKDASNARRQKLFVTCAIVVILGVAWRAIYVSNQRELALRRAMEKDRAMINDLREVPGRRFPTVANQADGTHRQQR